MTSFDKESIKTVQLPDIGTVTTDDGMLFLDACSDGHYQVGQNGVTAIVGTGDSKVEFIAFEDRTLAYVRSATGYPAYYPVHPARMDRPVRAGNR